MAECLVLVMENRKRTFLILGPKVPELMARRQPANFPTVDGRNFRKLPHNQHKFCQLAQISPADSPTII